MKVPVHGNSPIKPQFPANGGCITDEVTYATFNTGMFGAMVQWPHGLAGYSGAGEEDGFSRPAAQTQMLEASPSNLLQSSFST